MLLDDVEDLLHMSLFGGHAQHGAAAAETLVVGVTILFRHEELLERAPEALIRLGPGGGRAGLGCLRPGQELDRAGGNAEGEELALRSRRVGVLVVQRA